MNSIPPFLKNKYTRTLLIWGAIALGVGSIDKDPVTKKREDIITSMNFILDQDNVKLQYGEECTIMILGEKQGMEAALVCNNTLVLSKKYPEHTWGNFLTQITEIQIDDTNKLELESGCMIIEEDEMLLINPQWCTENIINPKSKYRITL